MAKRPAEADGNDLEPVKNGDRPMDMDLDEAGEFEDEFEDEFESEDELFEAGVDGRPDDEREAEEKQRAYRTVHAAASCH
jgi:ribosome assembly protein RRB1